MTDELTSQLASLRISRDEPVRSRGPRWFWLASVAGLAGLGVGFHVLLLPWLQSELFATAVSVTELRAVSPGQPSVALTAAGYVVAQRLSRVAPKVAGKVVEVSVRQGDAVTAGQLLLTLDEADDTASIAAASSRFLAMRARTVSATAAVATLAAELEEVRIQEARQRRLARDGVVPAGVAEDLAAHVTSLSRRVAGARADASAVAAEARAQQSEVKALETRLTNLQLRSPISGRVVSRPPQRGEVVSPQPPGVTVDMGTIEIADFDSLDVETDVPEQRLQQVAVGAPTEIVLDAFPSRRYRGRVEEITPRVDRSKATVIVRVGFVDEKEGVMPDMAARVAFSSEAIEPAALNQPAKIVVPSSAVANRGREKVVFVVDNDIAHAVPVKLGASMAGGFELLEGPRLGVRLVAAPADTLVDGQRVQLKRD